MTLPYFWLVSLSIQLTYPCKKVFKKTNLSSTVKILLTQSKHEFSVGVLKCVIVDKVKYPFQKFRQDSV